MTRVIETDAPDEQEGRWIDSESGGDGWDDGDAIPRRPRGRFLRPLPLALIVVTIAAAGFLGGVEAQKGSEGVSSVAGPGGGAFAALAAAKGGAEAGGTETGGSEPTGEGATGVPSFGASSAAATGTVTSVEGQTIFVKESDGTTVAVKAGDGSTVTRDASVSAKKIHPGDTVTVEGSKHGSTVQASSIAATESGVGAGSSVESLFE
jgi:hypothetical protein